MKLSLKLVTIFSIGIMLYSGCSSGMKLKTGEQTAQNLSKEITVRVDMNYLLYLPQKYSDEERQWPVLFFLHGMGERGSDLEKVKVHGPPRLIAEGKHFPFLVVSPQCPDDQWWSVEVLKALVDDVLEISEIGLETIEYRAREPLSPFHNNVLPHSPTCQACGTPVCRRNLRIPPSHRS